jgi:type I site-specific restriction-modification system R (restriction) subunit
MQLNFPTYKFKTKREQDINYVFDILRKRYVVLTPEEWVRQHVIHYLITDKKYPQSLLAVERGLNMNGRKKRFDLLAFNKNGQPYLLIECKSPDIEIKKAVFEQIAVYNSEFSAPYLLVTNGLQHIVVKYSEDFAAYAFLSEVPDFF